MAHLGPEPEVSEPTAPAVGSLVPGGGEPLVNPRPPRPVGVESNVGAGLDNAPASADPHVVLANDVQPDAVEPAVTPSNAPPEKPVPAQGQDAAVLQEDDRV